jgi:hypothetical protein
VIKRTSSVQDTITYPIPVPPVLETPNFWAGVKFGGWRSEEKTGKIASTFFISRNLSGLKRRGALCNLPRYI